MKINIIGASGTGKTTLAKALAIKLQCAHFDSDDYYHYPTDPPYQKQRSSEERLDLLMKDLNKNLSWVLSGGAGLWVPAPSVEYSLVVFLYLSLDLRLERIREREHKLYGSRIQVGGDMEADHVQFMKWTAGYDDGTSAGTNTLPCHLNFLQSVITPTLKLEGPMNTPDQIDFIVRKLNEKKIG